MTIEEALAVLERGQLEPCYVVTGPNLYWRTRWIREARRRFLGAEAGSTGYVRLENPQDAHEVNLEIQGGSLFERCKVVVVEGARFTKKDEWLAGYLDHPSPDTLLIVLEDKASPALEKSVGQHRVVSCDPLPGLAFRRFVKHEAKTRGVRWDEAATEIFCRVTDGNEYMVVQELEKLALMFPDRVSANDVREAVHPLMVDDKPWDAADALLRRDGAKALAALSDHLEAGMAPLFLFIVMARQVIQIDRARKFMEAGQTLAEFQKAEGLRDFVAKKVWTAKNLYTADELDALLEWAYTIDVAMKTGYGEPEVWLVLWTGLWANKKSPRSTRGANV